MKALSIRQPWAWLIVSGIKDIENRSRKTNFRGQFLIHASQTIDTSAYISLFKQGVFLPEIKRLITGGIIGIATIEDCVTEHKSKWFTGPYGYVISNSRPVKFFQIKGQQWFFNVPDITETDISRKIVDTVTLADAVISSQLTGLKKLVLEFLNNKLPKDQFVADRDLRSYFGETEGSWDSVLRCDTLRKFRTVDKQRHIWWGKPESLKSIKKTNPGERIL